MSGYKFAEIVNVQQEPEVIAYATFCGGPRDAEGATLPDERRCGACGAPEQALCWDATCSACLEPRRPWVCAC